MKYALIIGNNKYDDEKLAQLKTPAADSQALAKVLDDKTIGSFDEVTPLINQTETRVRRAISTFLTNKKPDDLVLLYFSGHGVLDDRGRLYLALKDTQVNLLKATSIPSSFVADEMDSCRSKRQILVLDCCHSGAFARGTKGEQKAITETTFEGSGFGRVVLTASDSTQYALEGDQIIRQTELSLFTHFLLEGLKTGEADTNNDGHISLDEWYDYTYAKVISETPRQVPHKWSYNQQGDLLIARNPYVKKRVVELPYELQQALESSFVGIRESAVNELGKYLRSRDPEMAALAVASLEKMKEDDSRRISSLAERLLAELEQARIPDRKVISSKTTVAVEPETVNRTGDEPPAVPKMAAEIEFPSGTQTSQPHVETSLPAGDHSASREFVFHKSSRFKWIGTAVLAIVSSLVLYYYQYIVGDSGPTLRTLFGAAAGSIALAQWYFFRNRLGLWWIPANAVTGLGLGVLHHYLYENTGWGFEDLRILLAVWVVLNSVLGPILMRTQEKSGDPSSIVESGARQKLFLLLLSASLVLASIANILLVSERYDYLGIFWILYGISAILTSIAFVLNKEVPRSFGFITLAIFLLFDGINVERLAFNSDYPLYYFTLIGIIALVSGSFFAFQKETWRNPGFILLSGYLLLTGAAGITVYDTALHQAFLLISAFFAVPAVSFLLPRSLNRRVFQG